MFDGSEWSRWATEDGLGSNNVTCLLVDASGQVWVGTENGLSRYGTATTSIAPMHQDATLPRSVVLYPNYPNPFNPLTTIAYDLPQACDVTLTIYTITGQKVATMVSGHQQAGHYKVTWDDRGCASGIYFYRLEAGEFVETR